LRKLLAACGALALSVLLVACGGEPSGEGSANDASAEPAATAPDSAASAPPAADATDTLDGTKLADLAGDPAKGEKLFLQCKTCHALEAGENRIGPSLHGIIGQHSGTVAGFSYSVANKNSGISWTPAKLFQFLEKPQRVIPGTKMAFAGISVAQNRADLIAYLQTASK
jgi:cytochrome c